MKKLQVPAGQRIEDQSFRMILQKLGPQTLNDAQLAVVVRVIHATADFDFADNLKFHPQAVEAGVEALRNGANVVSDVRMIEVGVSSRLLTEFGGETCCEINNPLVRQLAEEQHTTRSVAAMRYLKPRLDGSVVAIGNAPTALFEVIRLVQEEEVRPALIVGVPVGFINTVESKDALAVLDHPHITALGRKGGSTVAVAIVNALLRLAAVQDD